MKYRVNKGFGTIRNNTALKHYPSSSTSIFSFGTIRNNTALKPGAGAIRKLQRFGTIRNNTALKHEKIGNYFMGCFGTIRNNTALKRTDRYKSRYDGFWNHSKQHSSKTYPFRFRAQS